MVDNFSAEKLNYKFVCTFLGASFKIFCANGKWLFFILHVFS